MTYFYTPWKHQKTSGFLMFSGGIERCNITVFPKVNTNVFYVQKLAIEICKVFHVFWLILNDVFVSVSHPYNFRRNDTLQIRRANSFIHGIESISFLGPMMWDLVLNDIKLSQSLSIFKRKIKKWVPLQCPCRLCKTCRIYVVKTIKLTRQEWRLSFEYFFDKCVNKCAFFCQFVHINSRNSFGKDSISCSVTELGSISSMLLLYIAWNVSLRRVILVRIFPHSGWIGEIPSISRSFSLYSFQMRENTEQNNSEYGHFLRSVRGSIMIFICMYKFIEFFLLN